MKVVAEYQLREMLAELQAAQKKLVNTVDYCKMQGAIDMLTQILDHI